VDASGALRAGSVNSAWNLRGHHSDKADIESKLTKLNEEWPEGERPIDMNDEDEKSDLYNTTTERASMDDLTQDTWVMWDSSGGMAYGKVVDTIEDGQYDEEIDGDQVITAPAALIEVYELADGSWQGSETMVATNRAVLSSSPKTSGRIRKRE
jgi:hypothetical protein